MSPHLLPLVSVAVGIASLSWAIFVTFRRGDITRKAIKIVLGLTGISSKLAFGESKTRRLERSTLILVGRLERPETGYFPIWLGIRNTSQTALKNVRVLLDYPTKHYLKDLSLVTKFKFQNNRRVTLDKSKSNSRDAAVIGEMAHVAHELGLIRPGEGVVLAEPTVWSASRTATRSTEEPLESLPLAQRLERVGIAGSFTLNVFVAAENCLPVAKRFNILWLNDDLAHRSQAEMDDVVNRIAEGFWGRMPSPGLYFAPWPLRSPSVSWEAAEVFRLDLASASHGARVFRVAEPEPLDSGLAKIPMPPWNYRDEPRPNLEEFRLPFLSRVMERLHPNRRANAKQGPLR